MKRPPETLAAAYTVLLTGCVFGWPMVLGFGPGMLRAVWIIVALLAVLISTETARRQIAAVTVTPLSRTWVYGSVVVAILIAVTTALAPISFFSDEAIIAIPTMTIVWDAAGYVGWTAVLLMTIGGIGVAFYAARYWPRRWLCVIPILGALMAGAIALHIAFTTSQLIRYPPLVHVVQGVTTAMSLGSIHTIRLPVALWTLLGFLFIGLLTPRSWTGWTRGVLALGLLLTPLGWTYHFLLYQTAGELALGIASVLLLARILTEKEYGGDAAVLGMTLALWCLERPTALALVVSAATLLFLMRKRHAAIIVGSIALPIGLLWLVVYLLGTFQYDFLAADTERTFALLRPIMRTLEQVPASVGVIGIGTLLIGSLLIARFGDAFLRAAAASAWLLGGINTLVHAVATVEQWHGYGRFNALLLLPLAVSLVGFTLVPARRSARWIAPSIVVLGLVVTTPWNIPHFLARMRAVDPKNTERSVTGGVVITDLPHVAFKELTTTRTPIILSPDYSFLDLAIAQGLLTPEERTSIITRSKAWTAGDAARPVIVVAPSLSVTYTPNISAAEEQRLRAAKLWAQAQTGSITLVGDASDVVTVR